LNWWEVDLMGVDLMGVGFVGVDLVGGHQLSIIDGIVHDNNENTM